MFKNLDKIGIKNSNIVDEWIKGLNSGKRDTSAVMDAITYSQWLEAKVNYKLKEFLYYLVFLPMYFWLLI